MSAATHPGTYGFCGQKDAATQTKKSYPHFTAGRIHCKASVIAYAMNNETILCAGQDIFDGMLGSKETDAENCSCVSVSDKEFARLHSKFGLKKEDVLEAIKAYAQELGLEYGPVNYFMMCDPKYANDLGEVVQ